MTDPSSTDPSTSRREDTTSAGWTHLARSDLFPERICPPFDNAGGYGRASCRKNSSRSPPLIYVVMYICENSRRCIFNSFVSALLGFPLVQDVLKMIILFFVMEESIDVVWLLVVWNSSNWSFPIFSTTKTFFPVSSFITSLFPNWISYPWNHYN